MSTEVLRYLRPAEPQPSGRDAELALLLREHEEAHRDGRARFVFVRGPRGVGKSHLVAQVAAALAAQGVPVFEGASCRDARRAWGLVAPLLRELVAYAKRAGVPGDVVARLARAVAPVEEAGGEAAAGERRLALFDGVAELLGIGARACPLVVLPDLDVADRASLELVRYLAALVSTPSSRVSGLFVLTFRGDEALPAPLAEVLAHVSGRTVSLGGLDLEGIRAYLSRAEVAQRLLEVTGGVPEALGELFERPAPAVDFFTRRLARLAEPQRAALAALAHAPEALTTELLAAALGAEVSATAAVLDALVAERLLAARVVDGRPAWAFAREAERRAARGLFGDEARRATTLALGRALAANGRRLAAAELLLAEAPAEGALVALEAARELLGRGALEDAAALFARAAAVLRGGERLPMLEPWARALALLGDYRGAARRFLEAGRRGGQPAAQALEAARLLLKLGRVRHAGALLDAAAAHGAPALAVQAARAEVALATGRAAEAVAAARGALEGVAGDDEVSLALRQTLGKALLVRGEAAEARALFAQNAARAEAAGLAGLAALARLNEGVAAFKLGDRDRAIACWQATPPESRPVHAHAEANLGSVYAEAGDFELAQAHLGRALAAFSRFGSRREVALAASNLARHHHFLGELERAAELSQHALKLGAALGDRYLVASASLNLGAVAVDGRQLVEARRHLEAARDGFEALGNDGFAALAAAWKARAHLLAGERAQAEAELARRCVERGAQALGGAALEVELTRSELCLLLGDLLGASRAAARAREALLDTPDLEGPIRAYALMGRLRLAASDPSGAQAEFARAGRLLDELVQRVPPLQRAAFLSVPRRAEVVAAVEPELRLPRAMASLAQRVAVEKVHGLVGRSPALQRVARQLEPIGKSSATVLIRGESGTGKEVLADALHALSPRRHMPLVKVNCAAMVEELLLSELFGHEKGAFTGAVRERKGRFEVADGGTIFLDEIGDISPKAQVALLRVLQEREFERVGGSKTIRVDVRIICATNRDLEMLIAQGRFRSDLYYRLKGVMLELPPLRERLEDLPLLAQHFLERAAKERGEVPQRLADESLTLLGRHAWPGNVREFENVIASAAIFADGPVITPEAFRHVAELEVLLDDGPGPLAASAPPAPRVSSPAPAPVALPAPPPPLDGPLDYYELARRRDLSLKELRHEVEMQCIRRALEDAGGNISEAARLLKMKRSRLSQIVNGETELKEAAHGED